MNFTTEATDASLTSLIEWGIGGVILAVFVAPTFLLMVRSSQKRDEARTTRDDEERKLRSDREGKLVDALVASVEQQKLALEQWRSFEVQEEKIHQAILAGLSQVTSSMAAISDRMRNDEHAMTATAQSQVRIAELLQTLADRMKVKTA